MQNVYDEVNNGLRALVRVNERKDDIEQIFLLEVRQHVLGLFAGTERLFAFVRGIERGHQLLVNIRKVAQTYHKQWIVVGAFTPQRECLQ